MVSRMYVVLQEAIEFCVTSYVMARCGVIKFNYSTSINLQVGPTNVVHEMEPTIGAVSVKKVNMSKQWVIVVWMWPCPS
jgi:hypothetical protein